ncbi:hypothetical protein SME10J_23750 [Serratia marcescens]|nr:hypothetical protein SME10J_23750 [Serratia marcescens]
MLYIHLLPGELTAGIAPAERLFDMIAPLTLDSGKFPKEGFEVQFMQGLVRQLREVLSAFKPVGLLRFLNRS